MPSQTDLNTIVRVAGVLAIVALCEVGVLGLALYLQGGR